MSEFEPQEIPHSDQKEVFEPNQSKAHEPVPQMGPNNLSNDYMNEVSALHSFVNSSSLGPEKATEMYKKFGIKTYLERFPQEQYDNVITEENKELITQLDELVLDLRAKFETGSITVEEFNELYQKINEIVRGEI